MFSFRFDLETMQKICCLLSVRSGGDDRPFVVLQDLEPALYVCRMIIARLRRQRQIGAKKGRAKFGDQFLAGVTFIAPLLASEFTIQPFRVPCPVRELVRQSRIVGFGATEAFKGWHLHMITAP